MRSNGSNEKTHAVEDMTWVRNTRNHLRTLVPVLGLGLGLVSLETLRGHSRQEGSHNAIWSP